MKKVEGVQEVLHCGEVRSPCQLQSPSWLRRRSSLVLVLECASQPEQVQHLPSPCMHAAPRPPSLQHLYTQKCPKFSRNISFGSYHLSGIAGVFAIVQHCCRPAAKRSSCWRCSRSALPASTSACLALRSRCSPASCCSRVCFWGEAATSSFRVEMWTGGRVKPTPACTRTSVRPLHSAQATSLEGSVEYGLTNFNAGASCRSRAVRFHGCH